MSRSHRGGNTASWGGDGRNQQQQQQQQQQQPKKTFWDEKSIAIDNSDVDTRQRKV
jgi:hypothetical protein